MHKKYVIITGLILFFSILWVSGCEEKHPAPGDQQPTGNSIIGTWKIVDSSPDNETYSFYTNGSAKDILSQVLDEEPLTTVSWFTYTSNETSLCLTSPESAPGSNDSYTECFSSVFSENASRLTLSFKGTVAMVLTKMS